MLKGRERQTEFKNRVYPWTLDPLSFLDKLLQKRSTDAIGNRFVRRGTSNGATRAEVQAASSKRYFANCLNVALKSAKESRFLMRDMQAEKAGRTQELQKELEVFSILGLRSDPHLLKIIRTICIFSIFFYV